MICMRLKIEQVSNLFVGLHEQVRNLFIGLNEQVENLFYSLSQSHINKITYENRTRT